MLSSFFRWIFISSSHVPVFSINKLGPSFSWVFVMRMVLHSKAMYVRVYTHVCACVCVIYILSPLSYFKIKKKLCLQIKFGTYKFQDRFCSSLISLQKRRERKYIKRTKLDLKREKVKQQQFDLDKREKTCQKISVGASL